MRFREWLVEKLNGQPLSYPLSLYADEYASMVGDIYIREMAFWCAANLYANAISKCEFKTFSLNVETRKEEYYLWNVEPNRNQNSSAFLRKLITKLYRNNECLVIENNRQLLIADDFERKPYALYDDKFTKVTVEDFTFDKTFFQPDVLYFKLSDCNMRNVINGIYDSYSKLIAYSMNAYQRSRGTKGIFKYDTLPVAGTEERRAFDALINEKIGKWLSGDNAALPLGKGQEWKELEHKTYSSESTRDIRAQIDDISDFTAKGYLIPPALMRGDVQDISTALDLWLTIGIDPLCDMIQEEINRKRSGYAGFSSGTYVQIDTKAVKHIDLLNVSASIDKLIGSGAYCINDIRKLVGDQGINEPWADQHFITKNYATIEEFLKSLEGGETKK